MKNQVNTIQNLQKLYWTAAEAWSKAAFDIWRKANEDFWNFYHPNPHRRIEDRHKKAPCQAEGARLAQNYGRRCHDVDVEHI